MLNLHIGLDQFGIVGELIEAHVAKPDGSTVTQFGCPGCLARIYSKGTARPGSGILRAGTLDASDELKPVVHLWTSRKQTWVSLSGDAVVFETQPADPREWLQHLRPAPSA